tara:strand:+ start:24275 stop:24823 length:549 start_codon:yes stop_codon:yes gene_type:complete
VSPRKSSLLLLLSIGVVVVLLFAAKLRNPPRPTAAAPETPVTIHPPHKIRVQSDDQPDARPPSQTDQPASTVSSPGETRPRPREAVATSISPNAVPVASISRLELALDDLEERLASSNTDGSRDPDPNADRFGIPPSPIEKEDNVQAGIVFTVDKDTKKVKVEKNTFRRIADAIKAKADAAE